MASQELVDYVKERRREGFSDDNIRTVLLNAGYSKNTIEEALSVGAIASTPNFPHANINLPPKNSMPVSSVGSGGNQNNITGSSAASTPPRGFFAELFAIYRSRIWISFGLLLLGGIVGGAIGGLLFIIAVPLSLLIAAKFGAIGIVLLILALAVVFIADLWVQLIFGLAIINTNVRYEEKLGIGASLESMPRKAWQFLGTTIIFFLIVVGGFILAIIPGIFLSIAFSLVYAVFVIEGQRNFDGLLRSRDLIKGHWWYVCGCMLFVTLVPEAIFFIFLLLGIKFSIVLIIIGYAILVFSIPLTVAATAVLFRILQPQRPQIEPPTPSRKWKYALFMLPTLALIVVAAIFFIRSGASFNPAAIFQSGNSQLGSLSTASTTYANDQYHFSMIIPADYLNIATSTNQSGNLQTIFHPTLDPAEEALTFEFDQYGTGSLNDFVAPKLYSQTSSLQIDGQPAIRGVTSLYGVSWVEYVIQNNGAFYVFTQGPSMTTSQFDAAVQSVTFTSASQHQYSDAPALPVSLSPGPSTIISYYPIQQGKDGVSSMGILPIVIKNNSDEDIALTSVTLSESVSPTNANSPFNTATLLQTVPENSSQSPAISSEQDFSLESSGVYAVTLETIGQIVIPAGASSQFSFQVQMYGADANPLSSKVGVKFYVAANSVSGYGVVSNAKLNQSGSATNLPMTVVPSP